MESSSIKIKPFLLLVVITNILIATTVSASDEYDCRYRALLRGRFDTTDYNHLLELAEHWKELAKLAETPSECVDCAFRTFAVLKFASHHSRIDLGSEAERLVASTVGRDEWHAKALVEYCDHFTNRICRSPPEGSPTIAEAAAELYRQAEDSDCKRGEALAFYVNGLSQSGMYEEAIECIDAFYFPDEHQQQQFLGTGLAIDLSECRLQGVHLLTSVLSDAYGNATQSRAKRVAKLTIEAADRVQSRCSFTYSGPDIGCSPESLFEPIESLAHSIEHMPADGFDQNGN